MGTAVKMFSTAWCGYCRRLKRQLNEVGVPFEEIDLDREPEHGAKIMAVTGGLRIVPTLEIGEHLLVNPTLREVTEALAGG